MTTQHDLDFAASSKLAICPACGWNLTYGHADRCDSQRGSVARKLIAAVPEVKSGQLGYGDGRMVFEIEPSVGNNCADFAITFNVERNYLSLNDVSLFGRLSVDDAASLVRVLKRWSDEIKAKAIGGSQ